MAVDQAQLQRQQTFERMWLVLGPDCTRVTNNQFQNEVAAALNIASRRWNQLVDLESQILREEAALAARPKKRPSVPTDDMVPDRTLERWAAAWVAETEGLREGLKALKAQAKAERTELESYRGK